MVENTLIYKNLTSGYDGGGIHAEVSMVIANSTIANNSIPNGRYGGALSLSTGLDSVLVFNTVFFNNKNSNRE